LPFVSTSGTDLEAWVALTDTTNITLIRRAGGGTDNASWNSDAFNRGFLIVKYKF